MAIVETAAALMKSVCQPRKMEWEKPFNQQSIFVYGYDPQEDLIWDGFHWTEGIYIDGEIRSDIKKITHWSPAVFYSSSMGMYEELEAVVEWIRNGDYMPATTRTFVLSQNMFFALYYPDPRKMKLEKPQVQSEYYKPLSYEENRLHELTPIYGFWRSRYGWWRNDGAVKDVSYYMPDCRLELKLLEKIFGDPRESA